MEAEGWAVLIAIIALLVSVGTFFTSHQLSEYDHRASVRLEFQKLLLDVNKMLVASPDLTHIYDDQRPAGQAVSKEQLAFGYYLLNMLDGINAYYRDAPVELQEKEIGEWRAWAGYLALVLKNSEAIRRILEDDNTKQDHVYSDQFRNYCFQIVLGKQSELRPWMG